MDADGLVMSMWAPRLYGCLGFVQKRDHALLLVDCGVHQERVIELERKKPILMSHQRANNVSKQRLLRYRRHA